MPTPSFTFTFDATCNTLDAVPYVAKLTWNPASNRVEQQLFPLQRESVSPTQVRIHGRFDTQPLDIIETRLGLLKRRKQSIQLLAWYLAVPTGYLILLGDGQDLGAKARIDAYLAGTLSVHDLIQHKFDVTKAISEWASCPSDLSRPTPAQRRARLETRRFQLLDELKDVDAELRTLDLLPPREPHTENTSASSNTTVQTSGQ